LLTRNILGDGPCFRGQSLPDVGPAHHTRPPERARLKKLSICEIVNA